MDLIKNILVSLNLSELAFKIVRRYPRFFSDKSLICIRHKKQVGYWPDLITPKSFTEKINWLKLYDRKSEYTIMVDKYAVKEYVADKIGTSYIIPTLGVWEKAEKIDWNSLPAQFVLKTTHGGGSNGVIVCRDKSNFDIDGAIRKLNNCLTKDIFVPFREWPYLNVKKQIIAEMYMEEKRQDGSIASDLSDYKFFCFNGEPKYCQVIRDRHEKETIDFYDMNWVHQEFVGLNPVARNGLNPVARPKHLDVMVKICRTLAYKIPFIRVDLYLINDTVYFGELTFYPASGFGVFTPSEWNEKLGNLINLPKK